MSNKKQHGITAGRIEYDGKGNLVTDPIPMILSKEGELIQDEDECENYDPFENGLVSLASMLGGNVINFTKKKVNEAFEIARNPETGKISFSLVGKVIHGICSMPDKFSGDFERSMNIEIK